MTQTRSKRDRKRPLESQIYGKSGAGCLAVHGKWVFGCLQHDVHVTPPGSPGGSISFALAEVMNAYMTSALSLNVSIEYLNTTAVNGRSSPSVKQ